MDSPPRPIPHDDSIGQAHTAHAAGAGEVIGARYRVLGELGRGGMGCVLRCLDPQLGREVAVKRVRSEVAGDAVAMARFARETKAMLGLAHPNIVALLDHGTDAEGPYIVMELLHGTNLTRWVEQNGVPPLADVVDIGKQVCRALRWAHEQGLVHRDIKPSNLQRLPDGTIKLLDFGLARRGDGVKETQHTEHGRMLGTHDFAAPEQKVDATKADVRSDLYSLGATLYWLLHQHATLHEGYAPHVPAALRELLTQLLRLKPSERPATAHEVYQRLERVSLAPAAAATSPVLARESSGSVTCAHCQAENLSNSRYCVDCGEEVHIRCYRCNEPDIQRRRFCAHCRADLQARRTYEAHAKQAVLASDARLWDEAAAQWQAAMTACPDDAQAQGEAQRVETTLQRIRAAWAQVAQAEHNLDVPTLQAALAALAEDLPEGDSELAQANNLVLPRVMEAARTRAGAFVNHLERGRQAAVARQWQAAIDAWTAALAIQPSTDANKDIAAAREKLKRIPSAITRCESAANALDVARMETLLAELRALLPDDDERWVEWSTVVAPRVRRLRTERDARCKSLRESAQFAEDAQDFAKAATRWRELCDVDPSDWDAQNSYSSASNKHSEAQQAVRSADQAIQAGDVDTLRKCVAVVRKHLPLQDADAARLTKSLAEWNAQLSRLAEQLNAAERGITAGLYPEAAAIIAGLKGDAQERPLQPRIGALSQALSTAQGKTQELLLVVKQALRESRFEDAARVLAELKQHAPQHPEPRELRAALAQAIATQRRRRLVIAITSAAALVLYITLWWWTGVRTPRLQLAAADASLLADLSAIEATANAGTPRTAQHALTAANGRLVTTAGGAEAALAHVPRWLFPRGYASRVAVAERTDTSLVAKAKQVEEAIQARLALADQVVVATKMGLARADYAGAENSRAKLQTIDRESEYLALHEAHRTALQAIGARKEAAETAAQSAFEVKDYDLLIAELAKYDATRGEWVTACKDRLGLTVAVESPESARMTELRRYAQAALARLEGLLAGVRRELLASNYVQADEVLRSITNEYPKVEDAQRLIALRAVLSRLDQDVAAAQSEALQQLHARNVLGADEALKRCVTLLGEWQHQASSLALASEFVTRTPDAELTARLKAGIENYQAAIQQARAAIGVRSLTDLRLAVEQVLASQVDERGAEDLVQRLKSWELKAAAESTAASAAMAALRKGDLEAAEEQLNRFGPDLSAYLALSPVLPEAISAVHDARTKLTIVSKEFDSACAAWDTGAASKALESAFAIQATGPTRNALQQRWGTYIFQARAKRDEWRQQVDVAVKRGDVQTISTRLAALQLIARGDLALSPEYTTSIERVIQFCSWAELVMFEPDDSLVPDPKIRSRIKATNLPWRVRDRATGIEMVLIPPGTYVRGASVGDKEVYPDESPVHDVVIKSAFYLGVCEVTQGEWQRVVGYNPSAFRGDQLPVENVSWTDIVGFLEKCNGLRVPTEGEWEYACRAETNGARYGELDKIAWFDGNSRAKTNPVATKQPNGFGLFDMLGNVWEICSDGYEPYSAERKVDPQGASRGGPFRVSRGGCWLNLARNCRASFRDAVAITTRHYVLGFRVARTP